MRPMAPTIWISARSNARGKRQRGSTLVEQAIILPVLLILFFGVVDMGRALYAYSFVSYIAREATRWASVRGGGVNGKATTGDVTNFVKGEATTGINPANLAAATVWKPPANGSPLCPGGNANNKPGCVVQVTVTYTFSFAVPLIPGSGTIPMSSESQMIITQ
jgi:Flp pilus assembly protein TadG